MATPAQEPGGARASSHQLDAQRRTNIGTTERAASAALGLVLTYQGIKRRTPLSLLLGGAGALLVSRSVSGHSYVYDRFGIDRSGGPVELSRAVTVNLPPEQVYAFWRQLDNLPRFMRHLASVARLGENRYHWTAKPAVPGSPPIEWDADIVEDRPDEWLAWRSLPESPIVTHGSVEFSRAPGGRGTEIHVRLSYTPPAGGVLARLMAPLTEPLLKEDLRRLKRILETGELPTIEGQSAARAA